MENKNKLPDKDIFNTMEFTHQNLNRDFLTVNNNTSNDQFADFMSLIDEKYENDKKNKNHINPNLNSNYSKKTKPENGSTTIPSKDVYSS